MLFQMPEQHIFTVETFELRRDQWHVRRLDNKGFVLDSLHLHHLYMGTPWPTAEDALNGACRFIDRMASADA